MSLATFLKDARQHIAETGLSSGFQHCGVRSMGVLQTQVSKSKTCSVIDPMISLVLQGEKAVQYGTQRIGYKAGDVVVIGQALPMISAVVNATPERPFIAIYVGLDMQILRNVYSDMGGGSQDYSEPALAAGQAEAELLEAMERMFRLRRDPVEEQTLGAAALREVYFRVLRSKHGGALRQSIQADSKANQIAKAISHIRKEYRSTIRASELADIAGMSASVFYETFKQITANSPLQFQKDLRLLEAHRMLQQSGDNVSRIAHRVGYESPAQFSREFSRKFGASPTAFIGQMTA